MKSKNKIITMVPLLAALIFSGKAFGDNYYLAKIISIIDGDTIKVSINQKIVKVRLWGIDAPEDDQPLGDISTHILRKYINSEIMLVDKYSDRNKRIVGEVILIDEGLSINRLMVASCYAWHTPKYAPKDVQLKTANANCINNRKGLWGTKACPVKPWLWRKGKRKSSDC